jgi:molybdenum cofactor cytidylyltransferase
MNNTGIIILAAGNSSRFGSIKQLLQFNNKTLVQHVIDEATDAELSPVIVVTGANAGEVSEGIENKKATIVFNEHWKEGMASGIVTGLHNAITINDKIENIIIAVCDQPFISSSLFKQLLKMRHDNGQNIVACTYADIAGTPVLFNKKCFDALMNLQGEEGAKKILKANKDDVATINFLQGSIDIDTQRDYDDLLEKQN